MYSKFLVQQTSLFPLPMTDPCDVVPHAQYAGRSVWHTADLSSPVYHTDHLLKLTSPETIGVQLRNFLSPEFE